MINTDDAIWEFITSAINNPNIEVVNGHTTAPRPAALPYIVFFCTNIGANGWDSFKFDGTVEQMEQDITIETLVDIRGVGDGSNPLLFNIYAAAGNTEQQEGINHAGLAIYDRTPVANRPYIKGIETIPGVRMTLKIRGREILTHNTHRIDIINSNNILTTDSGGTLTLPINVRA